MPGDTDFFFDNATTAMAFVRAGKLNALAFASAKRSPYDRNSQGQTQISYVVRGNGGHGLAKLSRKAGSPLRTPQPLPVSGHADNVTLEKHDVQDYGCLCVIVTATPSLRRMMRRSPA